MKNALKLSPPLLLTLVVAAVLTSCVAFPQTGSEVGASRVGTVPELGEQEVTVVRGTGTKSK